MKQIILITILGFAALGGGVGLIVAADHFGWIGASPQGKGPGARAACEHGVDATRCPFCRPQLIESDGWCDGHNVAEALCTRCRPAIIPAFKSLGDWCAEHGLPESQCTLCGAAPTLAANGPSVVAPRISPTEGTSSTALRVNRPPSAECANAFATVVLKSADIARRAGLSVERVRQADVEETVACHAVVAFNGDRVARLASRLPGTIAEVRVSPGDRVQEGEVLAVVESSDLGSAKASYLQAHSLVELWQRNLDREQRLMEQRAGTEREVLEAETRLGESRIALAGARQHLLNVGLAAEDLERLAAERDTSGRLALRAPFAGVITERRGAVGEVIDTATSLLTLADLSNMWITLDVNEADGPRLTVGQQAVFKSDALPGQSLEGTITWISPQVDARSRTIAARVVIDNASGVLRAGLFGRAEVRVRRIENAILIPESAVQWDGCCNIVFIRHTDTIYQPYKVTLGFKHNGWYVVEDGVPPGEFVVTQGSFLLKTEVLKGHIGAGCCEVDPGANR